MLYGDTKQHNLPHVHVKRAEYEASLSIPAGEVLAGELDRKTLKQVRAWIALHEDELLERWERAARHQPIEKVD